MDDDKRIARLARDLRTGLLTLVVLDILLRDGPLHGYGVRKMIENLTGVWAPETTVYDALKRLEKNGLAESYWARSPAGTLRKYYRANDRARDAYEVLVSEARRLLGRLICG
ncbi:MAG: PadR family transcriptional regulator [Desulfurococcales archaeon]|nr:PadR family transcriptional regulator [Desulfurococcales archaeon]